MAEQRFSVLPYPTKTAATWRTSPRAERAIQQSAMRGQVTTDLSSGHAEQHGEYRRLGCTPTLRLLASPFASQFLLSYRSRRSLVNLDGGGRWWA
jgi:hypothetical protein